MVTGFRLGAFRLVAVPLVCALALAACAQLRPNPSPPYAFRQGPGDLSVSRAGGPYSGTIFSWSWSPRPAAWGGVGPGVNSYLWRGALMTVGSLPLVSADPFGGTIITDWYSPSNARGERFKESVVILSHDLRGDAVQVNVFRQVKRGGSWVDAPVNSAVQIGLQNKIVDVARWLEASDQG
jgi:hypothetical protein